MVGTEALVPLVQTFSSPLTVDYLSSAIGVSLIPLYTYIHVFPDVVMATPEFFTPPSTSLGTIINLALKSHLGYPAGSHVSESQNPPILSAASAAKNVHTIESVCNLLKISYSMPPVESSVAEENQPHRINEYLGNLLDLLLAAFSNSPLSLHPGSASVLINSITEFSQQYPLSSKSKAAFDTWLLSFSLSTDTVGLGEGFDGILNTGVGSFLGETTQNQGSDAAPIHTSPIEEEDLVLITSSLRSLVSLECLKALFLS